MILRSRSNTSRLTLTCPRVGLSAAGSDIFPSVCRVISGHFRQPDPTGFACRCALERPACGMIYLTPPMPTKRKLTSLPQRDATLIEPMECLSVSKLPEGAQWLWEILCGPPHKNSWTKPLRGRWLCGGRVGVTDHPHHWSS